MQSRRRITAQIRLLGAASVAALAAACATSTQAPIVRPGAMAPPSAPENGPRFVAATPSSCVPYARQRSGMDIFGNANTWWTQATQLGYGTSSHPAVGAVMALRIGEGRGHVAYVKEIVSDREILVDHANWHGRGETAVNVPVIDVSPANDWSLVRVLWLDSGQMGARSYPVEGFILPTQTFAAS